MTNRSNDGGAEISVRRLDNEIHDRLTSSDRVASYDPYALERFGGGATQDTLRISRSDALVSSNVLPRIQVTRDQASTDQARRQYFVDPSGNDLNPGTALQPWKTIQRGARSALPGSVVNVMPGEYHGQVNVTVSGNERDGFITFRSAVPGKAVLDLRSERVADDDAAGFKIQNGKFIELSGFEIKNLRASKADTTPSGVLVNGSSSDIRLNNLDIHHIENNINRNSNAHGISIYGDTSAALRNIVVSNNTLHDLKLGASEALVINGNVENFQITSNNLYRLNNIAIDVVGFEGVGKVRTDSRGRGNARSVLDQPRAGFISDNLVTDIDSRGNPAYGRERSAGGIYIDGGTSITVSGNRVERANIGIELASEHRDKVTSNIVVTDNLLKNNTLAGIVLGGSGRTNGGASDILIQRNQLIDNDTDRTGTGEIGFQNRVSNARIIGNRVITRGLFTSGSTAGQTIRDNRIDKV
ncbi:MAG: right-handed parallel beta-helix repeat-containing protein [Cyanobacteria bacterium SZAS-4]|nr:right-handed parallel beta-helix repeat-containing protein [Cyanobacteria bacterium SZAS-4]